MKMFVDAPQIYLYRQPVDFRNSIRGLSQIVETQMDLFKVVQHIRPKYSCRHCEQHDTEVHIKQKKMPPSVIEKSYATPSLHSLIITNKFQFSLPLYRQEKLFAQYNIHLSRQTQSEWMIKCASALMRVYQHLKQHLLKQFTIHTDEMFWSNGIGHFNKRQ